MTSEVRFGPSIRDRVREALALVAGHPDQVSAIEEEAKAKAKAKAKAEAAEADRLAKGLMDGVQVT